MFTFYYENTDTFTRWVKDRLEEMVVAHKVVDVENSETGSLPNNLSKENLPLLIDGHEQWTSESEIKRFLDELKKDLSFSRSLSSDACYVDPEDPSECL